VTYPANEPSRASHPGPDGDALAVIRTGVQLIALHELRDSDAAEEVAQETIRRLLDALSTRADTIGNAAAFARGIARHLIADARREAVRRTSLDAVDPLRLAVNADPLRALVRDEDVRRVRTALDTLSRDDRAVLCALYVDGLSPGDIAARTGQPSERIRKRKSRALARLRTAFGGHTSAPPPTAESPDDT
jgi:RNA polymerase sigma-70 factor (ECF subfamily)